MKRFTKLFMLVATVVILGYDVIVATNEAKGDTISELTLSFSWRWSIIPWSWGVVVGHLTWPVKELQHKWYKIYGLWAISAVLLLINILDLVQIIAVVPAILGFLAGHFLWAQTIPSNVDYMKWKGTDG